MRRTLMAASLAALTLNLLPGTTRAEMDIAPPVKITWNGFLHHWASVGENTKFEYTQAGTLLKRLRFRMGVEAYDGLNVVIVPELAAGGFVLLDGYAQFDLSKYLLDFGLPITLTAGQFKTPFGLNRMYTPPQLAIVDYSGVSNAIMATTNFWDAGYMLSWKQGTLFKLDAAWVEGLGPNQAAPGGNGFGTKPVQDFVARIEFPGFYPGLLFGGSAYHGQLFTTPGTAAFPVPAVLPAREAPKLITGAFLKFSLPGKSFGLEGEFVNRGVDIGGYTAQLSQYIVDEFQLVVAYDHTTNYLNNLLDGTRYIGGFNWFPGGPVRVSVNQIGSATGPSQQPANTRTVLQTQVTW